MKIEPTSPTGKSMNGKLNEFGDEVIGFIKEEKDSFTNFGTKAIGDIETMTAEMLTEVKTRVDSLSTRALTTVKENPVIAIAAAFSLGFVVAKIMSKSLSSSHSNRITH